MKRHSDTASIPTDERHFHPNYYQEPYEQANHHLHYFMIFVSILLAAAGWVAGFFSSVRGTYLLERRRAFRAVIGEIETIRSDVHGTAHFEDVHSRSKDTLKPLFFSAMTFLNHEQQRDAREIWSVYRDLSLRSFRDTDYATLVAKALGESVVTKEDALNMSLDRLQGMFEGFWP